MAKKRSSKTKKKTGRSGTAKGKTRAVAKARPKAKKKASGKAKTKAKAKSKAKAKAKAKPKTKAKAKAKTKAKAKSKTKAKAKAKSKTKAKAKAKVKATRKPVSAKKTSAKRASAPAKGKPRAAKKSAVATKAAAAEGSARPPRPRGAIDPASRKRKPVAVPINRNLEVSAEADEFSLWILESPKERLEEIRSHVLRADAERLERVSNLIEIAISTAWAERTKEMTRLLNGWLKDRSPKIRRLAVASIPLGCDEPAAYEKCRRLLRGMLKDPAREVRLTAISVLAEDPDRNLDLVRKWVKDPDARTREIATRSLHLAERLESILPLLKHLVVDRDSEVHWAAASVLYDVYERSTKEVLEVAKLMAASEDQDVRWAAAMSFFEHVFADGGEHVMSLMRQWSKHDDANLRWTLAHSMRFVRADKTLPMFRNLLRDEDAHVRRRVIWQVWEHFGSFPNMAQAAELLQMGVSDPSPLVRQMARDAVEGLAIDLEAAIPDDRRPGRPPPPEPAPPPPFGDVT